MKKVIVFVLVLSSSSILFAQSNSSMNEKKSNFSNLITQTLEVVNVETLTRQFSMIATDVMNRTIVFSEKEILEMKNGQFVPFPDVREKMEEMMIKLYLK